MFFYLFIFICDYSVSSLALGPPVSSSDLYTALPPLDTGPGHPGHPGHSPYYQGPDYSSAPGPAYPGPGTVSPVTVFHNKSLPSPGRQQRTKARSNAGKRLTQWTLETNT